MSSFTSDSFRNHLGCPLCVSAFISSLICDNFIAKKSVSNRICGREWDELSQVLFSVSFSYFQFISKCVSFRTVAVHRLPLPQHMSREKHLRSKHTHTRTHTLTHAHTHTHTHSVYVMLCLLLFHGNSDSTNAPFIVRCLFWLFSLNSACNCDSYNSGRQKYAVIGSLSGAFCAIGRLCSGRLSWVFEYVKAVFISTALLKVHLRMPY